MPHDPTTSSSLAQDPLGLMEAPVDPAANPGIEQGWFLQVNFRAEPQRKRPPRPTDAHKDELRASSDTVLLARTDAALPNVLKGVERDRAALGEYGDQPWKPARRGRTDTAMRACLEYLAVAVVSGAATVLISVVERTSRISLRVCGGCSLAHVGSGSERCPTCGQGLWSGSTQHTWSEQWIAVLYAGRIYRFVAAEAGPELMQAAIPVQALPATTDLPLPPTGLTAEAQLFAVREATSRLRAQLGIPPETTTPGPRRAGQED